MSGDSWAEGIAAALPQLRVTWADRRSRVGQFQAGDAVANFPGDNVCPFGASFGQHYGKFFAAVAGGQIPSPLRICGERPGNASANNRPRRRAHKTRFDTPWPKGVGILGSGDIP